MAKSASARRRTGLTSKRRTPRLQSQPTPALDVEQGAQAKPLTGFVAQTQSRDGAELSAASKVPPSPRLDEEEDVAPAGIEYIGLPGISKECQDAVIRLLQCGDRITHVRILSSSNDHCLLLTVNVGDVVAVKSGFASEYIGEGSRRFSYVLKVLEAHGAEIEEYHVAPEIVERVDSSALTKADIKEIDSARPLRPRRWADYVFQKHWDWQANGTLWQEFPFIVPFAVIDARLIDLVVSFWESPDDRLLTGYRRLEDIVRARTNIAEHGSKLFSQAFGPTGGKLTWPDIDGGEHTGRLSLFTGTYMAYRNRRAHRETQDDAGGLLAELMLLNQLYRLEAQSIER
jgi:hypothetical protein